MDKEKIKKTLQPTNKKIFLTLGIFTIVSVASYVLSIFISLGNVVASPLPMYIEEAICTGFECTGPELNILYAPINLSFWYLVITIFIDYREGGSE